MRQRMTKSTRGAIVAAHYTQRRQAIAALRPAALANARQVVLASIRRLLDSAQLHGFIGEDAALVVHQAGRILYVCMHAAQQADLAQDADALTMDATASALTAVVADPMGLEKHREAIIKGLEAAERLLPRVDLIDIARGAAQLDAMLQARTPHIGSTL